jgi:RNA polymerase sigma factor (sigma-70 family)
MTAIHLTKVVRKLRAVLAARETAGLTDADLWRRYVRERDDSAFETLVRKHGPMVLGVCRRVLRNEDDAEDAFQATFLVLVRKAASLRSPRTLANWLHGVALRTALQARTSTARRRAKEASAELRQVMPENSFSDLWPILDQELARLAQKYRSAVVLCDLEGKTRKEAARQLGWAEGTVASRLARGRCLLARRLARRGFAGSLVAAALAQAAAAACVPSLLVVTSVTAALEYGSQGALSGAAAALTKGVLKSMLLTRIKTAVAVFVVAGFATLGTGALMSRSWATQPAQATADGQQQDRGTRDRLHDRVGELKQQLDQLQKKIDKLGEEMTPRYEELHPRDDFIASRFKYRIPFEIGMTQTGEGGRIDIQEVWGTRPRIVVGGQYLVRGKYVLPPGEQRGTLYFYETATGNWGTTPTANMDLQYTTLERQKGEFTLMHGMGGPGYFHLYLADPNRYSRYFANVYFGTGDNVLRKKSW